MRIWLFLGSLNAFIALLAGAYGWHSLEATSAGRTMFRIAVEYHMWHALALLAVAWLSSITNGTGTKLVRIAGWAFLAGIVLFCGSLYTIGLIGYQPLPGTAPAGGISLMIGWAALITLAVRKRT
ncbi:MAG: DUF423 domain-containing protein [Rhodospirillales bacterium]|jgi:uncharacterized membrane protein YgdD (TMEM256/DUF423 family)